MHVTNIKRVSPEGNLIVANFPSRAISCANDPALRAIEAPLPGLNSIFDIIVPNGISDRNKALPISGLAFLPDKTNCPTFKPLGATI